MKEMPETRASGTRSSVPQLASQLTCPPTTGFMFCTGSHYSCLSLESCVAVSLQKLCHQNIIFSETQLTAS